MLITTDTRRALFCFAIILLLVTCLKAQSGKTAEIDSLMKKVHQAGVFNGNVLVVKNGKTVYRAQFGYADGAKKAALTAAHRFSIGSIGKEFNAVGIMMLKEQGKLSLDDKLSKFINGLPPWAERISVKNLLQYTSGLPDINWKTVASDADIFRDLTLLTKLNTDPGAVYAYNNSNTFLQRRIIEKLSGVSFQKFVETRMLAPCKMKSAVVDPDVRGANVAVSFNDDFVEDARQFLLPPPLSGWTFVTDTDLYQWSECLNNNKLISRASFKEILTPFSPGKQAGLGGGAMAGDTIKEHYHQGTNFDSEALLYSLPAEKLTIILLTNNKNGKVYEIKDAILAVLKGEAYKTPKKSPYGALTAKGLDNLKAAQIIASYREMKSRNAGDLDYDDDRALNRIGYDLLRRNRLDEALEIFVFNTEQFPASANAFDSLAETYLAKGDKPQALANYKKSLRLNPQNAAAKEMIEKLEKPN